jgi:hypothetical protein
MRTTLVIVAALALLVVAGCARQAGPAGAPTATDNAVSDVTGDVTGLDELEADLDVSELSSLDQELADIESLELQ